MRGWLGRTAGKCHSSWAGGWDVYSKENKRWKTLWGSGREPRPGAHPLALNTFFNPHFTPDIQRSGMADAPGRVCSAEMPVWLALWVSPAEPPHPSPGDLHCLLESAVPTGWVKACWWIRRTKLAKRLGTQARGQWRPVDWSSGACPLHQPATTAQVEALSSSPCFVLLFKNFVIFF